MKSTASWSKKTDLEVAMTAYCGSAIKVLVVQANVSYPKFVGLRSMDSVIDWLQTAEAPELTVVALRIMAANGSLDEVYAFPSQWTCQQWVDVAVLDDNFKNKSFHCPAHYTPREHLMQVRLAEVCNGVAFLSPYVYEAVNVLVAQTVPHLSVPFQWSTRHGL